MLWQPPLPERYLEMGEDELVRAIKARKEELGDALVILGHHYQQDDVIQFADFTGDSFKLSQLAAEAVKERGSKYVIFEGVHFMAESADILTPDDVQVILPDMGAGCSMADMANYEQTVEAWEIIHEALGDANVRVIPICYMNCTAAIKAFCGEHGGAVCTSSNADKILKWALAGGDEPLGEDETVKILFLPDQHLGRNTGAALGFDVQKDMIVWDPNDVELVSDEDIRRATFLLWKGHCSVHKLFRPEHVDQVRALWPDVTVIVHPECDHDVVKVADVSGSTEKIIQAIDAAEPGSKWAVGTEVHLVNRLAEQAKERGVIVRMLSECQCLCTTMYRIDMPHLLFVMDKLVEGEVVNRITVGEGVQHWSMIALQRMLDVTQAVKA
ncbi:quinolinate synthase NadA [Poriferisphaera sp. WC338]|uniref:quinolinate synthase NadA n=1 Tax=Poriferisphaera sp. WC338 TaxID=3425129 RepID=UPI003D81482E